MEGQSYKLIGNKIIIKVNDRLVDNSEELLKSELFDTFLRKALDLLMTKKSPLLSIFTNSSVAENEIILLKKTLIYLIKIECDDVLKVLDGSNLLLSDKDLFSEFIEFLFNYWRSFERYIICSSDIYDMDKRPYRVFNDTIEQLMHIVRSTYRDIQENVTSTHPDIYRQVIAGAAMAAITSSHYGISYKGVYSRLSSVPMIRQILLYPPLILNPPMNKRKGGFVKINQNPLGLVNVSSSEWYCYPAKVGNLLIYVYIHEKFLELGFTLCNLFEMANQDELTGKPDGVYLFGVEGNVLDSLAEYPTVFYEDNINNVFVAAAPNRDEFGYFGYLKKMILTLHNAKVMKEGRMPFHGALIKIRLNNSREATVLLIGDTGAGKSETIEAFRVLGSTAINDMKIIADDMGSLDIDEEGNVIGYGTEIGAFVRLDDLQPGYAFGQLDRAIIMSASQVNARAVLPITTYSNVIKGYKIDFVLYANNYDSVENEDSIIEKFSTSEEALAVFKEGKVMSKGTTASTGMTKSYFANIFGPPSYIELHDNIADKYFKVFFDKDIFVGQIKTRLGIEGFESVGPKEAAKRLLKLI